MYKAYTYLIGWSTFKKYYYGVRYAKGCNINDLWIKYFTSSEHVKAFKLLNGEPDIIEIRKTFNSIRKAKIWESKVLLKLKVFNNDNWLNVNYGFGPPQLFGHTHNKGRFHTEETKNKKRKSMIKTMAEKFPIENRYHPVEFNSKEYKQNMSEKSKQRWSGLSEEQHSEICNNISYSLTGKSKTGKAAKGHQKSEEHKRKISESNKKSKVDRAGKLWWNNNIINKRSKESPGPEWVKGKLSHNKSYNREKMKEIWALRKAGNLPMPVYS